MFPTCVATIKSLVRVPATWIWGVLFPVVLSTLFMFMFASFTSANAPDPVSVGIVEDDAWRDSAFSQVVDTLAEKGADQLLEVHTYKTEGTAHTALAAGDVEGLFTLDGEGTPHVEIAAARAQRRTSAQAANQSILDAVASSYRQNAALIADIAERDPAALADPAAVERALALDASPERVSLTRSAPDDTVMYYYALFGLVAMMNAEFAAWAMVDMQPNLSALGARRCVGGMGRARMILGIIAGCWAVSFASVAFAFAYVRLVVGVDFAGREALCLVAAAAASLASTAIGAFIGAVPLHGGKGARSGLLTGIACLGALFAGLYGEPSMHLANEVARAVPLETWLNPVKLICDMFHSLYFYEDLQPFAVRAAACTGIAVVLAIAGIALFGRRRYEHL